MAGANSPTVLSGVVEETLPRDLYRVRLDDGQMVTASLGGLTRQTTVRIIQGDRVRVEVSPLDPTRGRIKAREK
jgi:translation initiation factor IF-1